jgi:hypothetical protein
MNEKQRQAPRIQPFVVACRYVVGEQRVPAFLTDLSSRGARVRSDVEPPPAGTALVVEVRLRRQATHVPVPATVRWARESDRGGFVFGCSFDGVGPDAQKIVDEVVSEFQRRAASIG